MFFEGLDNDHGRAAGPAGVGAGDGLIVNGVRFWCKVIDVFIAEELPQSLHLLDPNVVGEQPVVTDAMKTSRQYMDEKATDELVGCQGHVLVSITPFAAIVLPLKGDTVLIASDEPAVSDRHSMGITRQVSEHGLGPGNCQGNCRLGE